jgi:hypothetical protein
MWVLALAAAVTVHDVDWFDNAYELVDTDGVPFLAVVADGVCEGDLAEGHARISIEPVNLRDGKVDYADIDRDGVDDVLVRVVIAYDDHDLTEYRIYTIRDGERVLLATVRDDRKYGVLTNVGVIGMYRGIDQYENRIGVERSSFRNRTYTYEQWVWEGDGLVERRDLRTREPFPTGH